MLRRIYNLLRILRKLSISGAVETLNDIRPIPGTIKFIFYIFSIGSSKKSGAIKFPECCYPISGDPCLAVHNEGGITIHRNECQNLKNFLNKPGKCSDVLWEKSHDSEFLTSLILTLKNEPGALADISKIISKNHSNIQSVATKTLDENFTELTAKLVVKDTDHLELIKSQLKNNKTVTNIERQQT